MFGRRGGIPPKTSPKLPTLNTIVPPRLATDHSQNPKCPATHPKIRTLPSYNPGMDPWHYNHPVETAVLALVAAAVLILAIARTIATFF